MINLFGIPNCDTVKRARTWLVEHKLPYQFHDFKKQGVPVLDLSQWIDAVGWEALVNRRGTTWRQLDEGERAAVVDAASASAALIAHPSLIKRPVVAWGAPGDVTVGFSPADWQARAAAN